MRGIYILYKEDKIVYVGKSSVNIEGRVKHHTMSKDFDKAELYNIPNMSDVNIIELYMIAKFKPILNVDSKESDDLTIELDISEFGDKMIDYTKEAMDFKKKYIHNHDDIQMINIMVQGLLDEGYSMADVCSMINEV